MSLPNNADEYVASAVKLAPTTAVSGLTAGGIGLQDWVYIATIVYTVLMAAHLVWKWIRERDGR